MDYYEILLRLTKTDKTEDGDIKEFDDRLQCILQNVESVLTEDDKIFITSIDDNEHDLSDIRYRYIRTSVRVLQNIAKSISRNDESLISVRQFHTIKICIELITAMGIVMYLLPGVGIDMAKLCPKALQICNERISDMQKYRRLQFTVNSVMQLYEEVMFQPSILAQIGPLLAALLQLSYAPLMKPSAASARTEVKNSSSVTFKMTTDLYDTLKKDQESFKLLLHRLLANCPMSTTMKELMVILGIKGAPKWLQHQTRKCLVQQLMQPNGVISIIRAVCDDTLDLGEHWNKLDTISRLIATPHGSNSDEYFQSICSQLLNLLTSVQVRHSTTIANCCIAALYEYNPDICLRNVVDVICDPLLLKSQIIGNVGPNESVLEKCIDNLTKCFITVESKFNQLPCKCLTKVALPLFSLYNSVRQSVCLLKSKVKQLVLQLLQEELLRNDLFATFLGHRFIPNFGNCLSFEFGSQGGVKITGVDNTCKYEEFADSLFDLTSTSAKISIALFSYLLTFLTKTMKSDQERENQNLLETQDDVIDKIKKQLSAVKLLASLASMTSIQKAQIEKPVPILNFTKFLFNRCIVNNKKENSSDQDDSELLYITLMLVRMILSERKPLDWTAFRDFQQFLKENSSSPNIPSQLLLLTQELIDLIETQGRTERKQYRDLSIDRESTNKFEQAVNDLADPLLPVRAHGLITLTKLIETGDPCASARKAVLLQLFKENLKHEDSFIYLAAINGLCALATFYPQIIIETLVQEYVDMPQRVLYEQITVETRTKLGEILVKITRALGDMASVYKNILINGFLCATKDADSLVRASSLSCLGELCKVLGFRLGNIVIEVIYCITCIIKTDKAPECRRAAVMVSTLLLRGLGKDTLTNMSNDLVDMYRGLKYLRDHDEDPVLRLHAQLSLEEIDCIVRDFLLAPPKLEKKVFLLGSS